MSFRDEMERTDLGVRGVLGDPVLYAPSVGSPVTVEGIFDSVYVRVDLGQPGISSSGPAVFLRLEDLPSNPKDDPAAVLTIYGVTYVAHEVLPDGIGGVRLLLHRNS